MKENNEYMEKIYEQFSNDIEPTNEMKEAYNHFTKIILDLKESLDNEQLKKVEELENEFANIISMEVKQAFIKGFSIAKDLN